MKKFKDFYNSTFIGMSSYSPVGKILLIEIGRAFASSSALAIEMGSLKFSDKGINGGAPRDN